MLVAGYTQFQVRGTQAYHGALRRDPRSAPAWTCPDEHFLPSAARRCAERELDRRERAGREVFTLRRCEPCDRWWPDGAPAPCPACSVPMDRVKVLVLERTPA